MYVCMYVCVYVCVLCTHTHTRAHMCAYYIYIDIDMIYTVAWGPMTQQSPNELRNELKGPEDLKSVVSPCTAHGNPRKLHA